jgi:hypothetical protein
MPTSTMQARHVLQKNTILALTLESHILNHIESVSQQIADAPVPPYARVRLSLTQVVAMGSSWTPSDSAKSISNLLQAYREFRKEGKYPCCSKVEVLRRSITDVKVTSTVKYMQPGSK